MSSAPPPVLRVANRHVFGLELPWLPAVRSGESRAELVEAFGRQIAMLRALAESGQHSPGALQLRIVVDEQETFGRSSRVLRVLLLGAANRSDDALALRARLRATLPPEFVVEDVDVDVLARLVDAPDEVPWAVDQLAEIRRAIESSDPETDAGGPRPLAPVLLRWNWTQVNLIASLGALHRLPRGAQLIVHLEPRAVSVDALGWLREEIGHLVATYNDEQRTNPLLEAVIVGYRRWLRDLPRACLHVRVLLVCPGSPVPVGTPEVVGADLTRSWESGGPVGTFDVLRPATAAELESALALVQLLQSHPVRPPEIPELAELLHLFDPHEASAAFRLPLPGPEGLPGLRSEPASTLPRGLASALAADRDAVVLGEGPSGDTVTLADDEINRHVLVAGLPGYGKTTTVHSILRQLWRGPRGRPVPFLVLDPAKTDYQALAEELGPDCHLVVLGSDQVAFNPLSCPAGVPRTVFATRIAAAFDAAYDLSAGFPAAGTVLTRAVHRVLSEDHPSLPRLYATVRDLVRHSEYSDRTKGEIEAALVNRLELLTDGSLGAALMGGPDAAVDWAAVLARPTIVLAREFAGPRERALLMSLVLAGLVSYREYHPSDGGLDHVTVVEEAHRVLAAGPGGGYVNDGAQVFVDAMAELRGAGEGFMVVEQAPSRLVPEVRKLVGTVIAHRTVDAEERSVLAASLTLPGSEQDLARLRAGEAVVLAADMLAPSVVAVDRGQRLTPTGPPVVSRSLASSATSLRLWCEECPVVCTGYRGAARVQAARAADPELSWLDARRAVTQGLDLAEGYCARAFAEAQGAATAQDWRARRRRTVDAYHRSNRTTTGTTS
ncbi:hypothetical protein [Blastococcus sp. SYSU D01042]